MHGKTSRIRHDGEGGFTHQPPLFDATRYHPLVVRPETVPDDLLTSARSVDDDYVMGLRHRTWAIESVQFHPECIRTQSGRTIFRSFIEHNVTGRDRRTPAHPSLSER